MMRGEKLTEPGAIVSSITTHDLGAERSEGVADELAGKACRYQRSSKRWLAPAMITHPTWNHQPRRKFWLPAIHPSTRG